MASAIYPLPLGEELARQVSQAAVETGLSQAEVMRQALSFGLPRVRKALRKAKSRLTTVNPLPASEARALYALPEEDGEQIQRMLRAQRLEVLE
jgi:hypothetical protein